MTERGEEDQYNDRLETPVWIHRWFRLVKAVQIWILNMRTRESLYHAQVVNERAAAGASQAVPKPKAIRNRMRRVAAKGEALPRSNSRLWPK